LTVKPPRGRVPGQWPDGLVGCRTPRFALTGRNNELMWGPHLVYLEYARSGARWVRQQGSKKAGGRCGGGRAATEKSDHLPENQKDSQLLGEWAGSRGIIQVRFHGGKRRHVITKREITVVCSSKPGPSQCERAGRGRGDGGVTGPVSAPGGKRDVRRERSCSRPRKEATRREFGLVDKKKTCTCPTESASRCQCVPECTKSRVE